MNPAAGDGSAFVDASVSSEISMPSDAPRPEAPTPVQQTGEDPAANPPPPKRIAGVKFVGEHSMKFEQDGELHRHSSSYFRGEHTNFYPKDRSLETKRFLTEYVVKGLTPPEPIFDKSSKLVAFGSCFAGHIANYLDERGYNVMTRGESTVYVAQMGDGIVNTHAIRQQFEWAWLGRQPQAEVWTGRDLKALGFDEEIRLATKAMFDEADAFIITLGLSEVWYDEPTGEVFWRAVPNRQYDPERHKFRVSGFEESLANLNAIVDLIHERRPNAHIIFTLSPIALTATFRPMACMVADAESKAILRAALGQLMRDRTVDWLHYMPSYEIVQRCFNHPYYSDRTHVHRHVIDFVMAVFERYYCSSDITDDELYERFNYARYMDRRVGKKGHKSVPSPMLT